MRKTNAWLFLSLIIGFTACNNDDDDKPNNSITSDEAAVIVSSSFSSNTSGVNFVSTEAAGTSEDLLEDNANGRVAACGASKNIDLSGESPDGGSIIWSYDFSYKFQLNCNDEEKPSSVSVDLSYSGDFSGPRLSTEHSGTSELDLIGLEESVENFLLEGFYKRSGSFEQKEGDKKSGSSRIEIELADVVIDKQTHKIISGTATYTLTGTVPAKGDYTYEGTVTFQGEDTADLKVGDDNFSLNLKSGDIVKK
jgi:hypothetical protein